MKNKLKVGSKLEKLGIWDKIPSDSINSVDIEFEFADDWKNLKNVAQFTQGEHTYNVLIENNHCVLPNELEAGAVSISVFGSKEDGSAFRETSIPVKVNIVKSGFVGDGETPIPPTPDLYAQLLEQLKKSGVTKVDMLNCDEAEDGLYLASEILVGGSGISDGSYNLVNISTLASYPPRKIVTVMYKGKLYMSIGGNELQDYYSNLIDTKVDKVAGKQLSTNDFTDELKSKLDDLEKVVVDEELSTESTNPVQNKIITATINDGIVKKVVTLNCDEAEDGIYLAKKIFYASVGLVSIHYNLVVVSSSQERKFVTTIGTIKYTADKMVHYLLHMKQKLQIH